MLPPLRGVSDRRCRSSMGSHKFTTFQMTPQGGSVSVASTIGGMRLHGYIEIGSSDGKTVVSVDDRELFDFLEDHLVDHDLEYEFVNPRGDVLEMHFSADQPAERIIRVLQSIDADEIRRVWSLNNAESRS